MRYQIVPVTPFEQNCTIFWCEATRQAAVIDPGGDVDRILAVLAAEQLTLAKVLVTHGHIDHAGGVAALVARTGVPVEGPHADDAFWIDGMAQQSKMFGFPEVAAFTPDRWLADGDRVCFGDVELEVLHCPGHTPGHVVFFHAPSQLAQVGDVLFQGSIGRTDFPRGDHATLIASIKDKLFALGDAVDFIPGHGPMSTLGEERRYNPFLSGRFG
ncbi:glyoxylase-like metal-dependent hydrolase (beta-lactamase superfamily II) [Azonexus fungiphilus]|uniref:Glyoxylase-like metal-dependent hydrolase (Beta-lactamase superfamily II) n=1 Tax=Azonexus fungiphilus TaxID=146940 RepID=A0A495VL14_9RHOO|nr:MBL fold metallo-hydrolase [Azonexus fungiphilus]RKT50046.1 glyoxylase-like metal-dependent hydrolase (beta-lactamase superfamily II) [Azonexus fungiphilus]